MNVNIRPRPAATPQPQAKPQAESKTFNYNPQDPATLANDTADISDLEAQDRIRHIPINRNQSEVGFEVDFADSVTVEIQLFNADLVQAD